MSQVENPVLSLLGGVRSYPQQAWTIIVVCSRDAAELPDRRKAACLNAIEKKSGSNAEKVLGRSPKDSAACGEIIVGGPLE